VKKILLACLIATSAFAGERFLGYIRFGNSTKSNLSQNPDGGNFYASGNKVQPFCIHEQSLITVRCEDPTYVCTDKTSCTADDGVELPADTLLPTSVGAAVGYVSTETLSDGGFTATDGGPTNVGNMRCAAVSMFVQGLADAGWHYCKVWERKGNE
jgi:hypothetical protein